MIPVIFGLSGPSLTPDERAFFAQVEPAGYILFGRNVEGRDQVRALTDSLRDLAGRDDLAILIDQEGGPVARMKPPVWPAFPAGPVFDAAYEVAPMTAIQATRANGEALGLMLSEVGVSVDCAPLLDVAGEGTTPAIANRAYGAEPMRVAALGRAMLEGLAAGASSGWSSTCPVTAARWSIRITCYPPSSRARRSWRSTSRRSARWRTRRWG